METPTVNITLSARTREIAFVICCGLRYGPEKLMAASSLLEKLREGTVSKEKMFPDPSGVAQPVKATVYENFLDNIPMGLTLDEKGVLISAVSQVKEWGAEEAENVLELQEKLETKFM